MCALPCFSSRLAALAPPLGLSSLSARTIAGSRLRKICSSGARRNPIHQSHVVAASEDDRIWPRRAQPDAERDEDGGGGGKRSWDDIAPTAKDADIDRAKETFFFQLASLGFGVRSVVLDCCAIVRDAIALRA